MNVSVGIFAHDEEWTIADCIRSFQTQTLKPKSLVLVSSSKDRTNQIARSLKIMVIEEEKRRGKAVAINKFLKCAKTPLVVVCSADVMPRKNLLEKMHGHFSEEETGIVSCRPVPRQKGFFGRINTLLWQLHHQTSLKKPKFGELIMFRNIITRIPKTAVDEEEIAGMIMRKGFKAKYEPGAVVFNNGPENMRDFIRQRRRIFAGHLKLAKKGHKTSTVSPEIEILKVINHKNLLPFVCLICLESVARMLGFCDYFTRKDHTIWKQIIKS